MNRFVILSMTILCILLSLNSCTNKKVESSLSEDEREMAERQGLLERESAKVMKDSTILLGIKLQCTEKQYKQKIAELRKQKKLGYKDGEVYYTFDFNNGIKANGIITPNFRNGRLFKLDISADWENPNLTLSSTVLFSYLNDIFKLKYKNWEDVMLIVSESHIYDHDWYNDGKHVSLSSANISYSCAKEECAYYNDIIEKGKKQNAETAKDI